MRSRSRCRVRRPVVGVIGAALLVSVAACEPPTEPEPVTVAVSPATLTVTVGDTDRLVASVANAGTQQVSWSSSDPGVAGVATGGIVTGVSVGTAVVRATSVDDPGASSSATVVVEAPPCTAAGGAMTAGQTRSGAIGSNACSTADGRHYETWTLSVTTSDVYAIDLTSAVFDPVLVLTQAGRVLNTDDDGGDGLNSRIVTSLSAGTYDVRVETYHPDGVGAYTLSVRPFDSGGGNGVQVSVSPTSAALTVGGARDFDATVSGTGDTRVGWSSTAPSVATVDGSGLVRAVSAGTTSIVATSLADPSRSASAVVTVSDGGSATVDIVVTNRLLNAINVTVNGTSRGSVPAGETRRTTVDRGTLDVEWDLVRTTTNQGHPVGDVLGGTFQTITNPGPTVSLTVDARIGDTHVFVPIIVNQTSAQLLMGVNEGLQSQNRCNCTVPAGSSGTRIGYYRLYSNSNVRAYRNGSGYTSSYVYWQSFASSVDPATGAITLRATSAPATTEGVGVGPTGPSPAPIAATPPRGLGPIGERVVDPELLRRPSATKDSLRPAAR